MDHSLSHVSGQYGAPMGRREVHGDRETAYNVVIRKVDLDQGGYDIGGAYWGTPNNLWRYFADAVWNADTQTDSEGIEHFTRAADYEAVKAIVMAEYPNATIISDTIDAEYREAFIDAYKEAALWSSLDDEDRPLDAEHNTSDISEDTAKAMADDCNSFIDANGVDLIACMEKESAGQAGHDFWLTRNGHGAGFWDRGLGQSGKDLSDACKPYGSKYLYVGEDGKIYQD